MKLSKSLSILSLITLLALGACGSNSSSEDSTTTSSNNTNDNSTSGTNNSNSSNEDSAYSNSNNDSPYEFYIEGESDDWEGSKMPDTDKVVLMCAKNTGYSKVYAWYGSAKNITASWPGDAMSSYDDNYLTYTFNNPPTTEFSVIFNNGSSGQTKDLEGIINGPGYYWYTNAGELIASDTMANPNVSAKRKMVKGPGAFTGGTDNASDYTKFKFWDEYPASYWKTINKYSGDRTDFRQESIYFAITTRFYNGDPSNDADCWDGSNAHNPASDPAWRGDFKGLIEKMDYIKALGFTAIWITPIVSNASGYDYHGYHAINFSQVDHRYLSEDVSFQDVINEAHKRDMKIVLDVVFNHTSNFGEENLFPMFIKDNSVDSDDMANSIALNVNGPLYALHSDYNHALSNSFSLRASTYADSKGDPNDIYHHAGQFGNWEDQKAQVTSIAGDCVDLNTENPRVAEYIVDSYGQFIRMGVDAFRIDTMAHINRLTLNKYYFPALKEYARRCRNDDNFFMFGEVCARVTSLDNHGVYSITPQHYTWNENKIYAWGDKDTNLASAEQHWYDYQSDASKSGTSNNCYLNAGYTYHTPDHSRWSGSSVIDFRMHRNFGKIQEAYTNAVNDDKYFNDATYNVVYVDSHDYSPEEPNEKTRPTYTVDEWAEKLNMMFTFRGIPCLYYGSEIRFAAGYPIDVGTTAPLSTTGRAYFGDNIEGDLTVNGFGNVASSSGTVKTTLSGNLVKHIQMLNKMRLSTKALQMGQYTSIGDRAFVKRYTNGSEDSIACVVMNGSATFSGLPNGKYVDLVTGDIKTGSSFTAYANGQSNLRVYVLNGSKIGGSPLVS